MPANMFMDAGNLRDVAAPLYIGARSGLMTVIAAAADVFAVRNIGFIPKGQTALVDRPIAVSQIRTRFVTTTNFATAQGLAFEYYKVAGFTAVHDTGSPKAVTAQRRKTTGFEAIPLTEISTVISDTAAITNGTYTSPAESQLLELAAGGGGVGFGFGSRWVPVDGLPLVLEKNEGIVCRITSAMGATGVGRLFVGIDGYRF